MTDIEALRARLSTIEYVFEILMANELSREANVSIDAFKLEFLENSEVPINPPTDLPGDQVHNRILIDAEELIEKICARAKSIRAARGDE